jgi:recombination protein RecA
MSLAAANLEAAPRAPIPAPPDSASFLRKIAGVTVGRPDQDVEGGTRVLPLRFGGIDALLPDGGLPRGAVVELAAPYGLARTTSIALAACAAAQAEARLRGGEGTAGAWCAWIDPTAETTEQEKGPPPTSLFAPAAARAGVDLSRLLVIRPPLEALSRVAARTAQSRVFSVIVVDLVGVPGRRPEVRLDRWVNPVRRLAMAVTGMETTVILLTDALAPRPLPLPVALRLELERAGLDRLLVSVAKDRRGRVSAPRSIAAVAAEAVG